MIKKHSILSFLFVMSLSFSFAQTIEIVTQEKIQGVITLITYSPDGTLIASGSAQENSIKIWDISSGKIIGKLEGHEKATTALEFNRDGSKLFSSAKDNKLIVWDLVNWAVIDSLTLSSPIHDFELVPNQPDQFISASHNGDVEKWAITDLSNPIKLYGTGSELNLLDVHDNLLVSGGKNGKIQIYDLAKNESLNEAKVHLGSVKGLHFFKDGKALITAGNGGKVNLWSTNDFSTSTSLNASRLGLSAFDINIKHNLFVTVSSNNLIKVWNLEGELIHEFKSKGLDNDKQPIKAIKISPDGSTMASSGYQRSPRGSKVSNKNVVHIWDLKRGSLYTSLEGTVNPIYTFDFHPEKNQLVTLGDDHTLTFWDFNLAEKFGEIKLQKPRRQIAPPRGEDKRTNKEKLDDNLKKGKKLKGVFDKVVSGDITGAIENKKPDVPKNLSVGMLKRSFKERSIVKFSAKGKFLITKLKKDEIRLYEIENSEPIYKKPLFSYQYAVNNLLTSPDERYLAVIGSGDSAISIIDLETQRFVKKLNTPAPKSNLSLLYEANSLAFSPDGKYFAVCFNTGKTFVYTTSNWTQVFENILPDNLGFVKSPFVNFSKSGEFMVVKSMTGIKKYRTSNFDVLGSEPLKINGFSAPMDKPEDYAITVKDNTLYFEDLFTGKVTKSIRVMPNQITHISINPQGMAGITFKSGQFILIDPKKGGEEEVLLVADGDNYIFKTAENFYKVSKEGYDLVTFRIGNQAFPFEQFDAIFNRPDLVLKRMGCQDEELINLYQKAYKKRIKKLGLEPTTEIALEDIPKTILKNASSIPAITQNDKVEANFTISDNKALKSYNVWVNNVPVHGKKGKLVSGTNQTISASIPLIHGINKIQIACRNKSGYESLIQTFYVEKQGPKPERDLYLIAIGTSSYKDNRFDLSYPVKDARDLVKLMTSNEKGLYENIIVDSLYNENVTADNITGLRTTLEKSKPNDVVVVFVAGHGVLDENFDYYFGTHDIDFTAPSEKGLAYEKLEHIMDGIKANKKILIMDTCHSGEVDKDDVFVSNDTEEKEEENQEDISFRAVGTAVKEDQTKATPTRLAGELFNDLRKGTGATVISSAGGVEFAMESDKWKNGLFTYCMLNGLTNRTADLDEDGKIMLLELQEYVVNKVSALSHGRQVPNSRIKNIELDFQVW